jgi:hypothetical protein
MESYYSILIALVYLMFEFSERELTSYPYAGLKSLFTEKVFYTSNRQLVSSRVKYVLDDFWNIFPSNSSFFMLTYLYLFIDNIPFLFYFIFGLKAVELVGHYAVVHKFQTELDNNNMEYSLKNIESIFDDYHKNGEMENVSVRLDVDFLLNPIANTLFLYFILEYFIF